jgi:hypothetical protein
MQSVHPTQATQRRQWKQPIVKRLWLINDEKSVMKLNDTPLLKAVPALAAMPALKAVPAEAATPALFTVPAEAAMPALFFVRALAATATLLEEEHSPVQPASPQPQLMPAVPALRGCS